MRARRTAWWAALLFFGLSAGLLGARPATGEPLELEGSWHVLIHYRDAATENPDFERWDDKVWRFEAKRGRLRWTEFPIVVFDDERGRFETPQGGRRRRVLAFWEPDEAQLAAIHEGLRVNPRGSKTKTLRGSPERGWRSGGGMRAESASIIGYSESWEIEGLPDAPVFRRTDTMGSARTDTLEGVTSYTTESVSEDGRELRGRFSRDGTRTGRFTMRRMGEPDVLGRDE